MHKIKLGDVAKEFKVTYKGSKLGMPIVGLEHLVPQEMKLTAWDGEKDNTFTKMFRKGHILFGRRRAYLKKAAVAPFDGICSGDITVIEAIPSKIVPELLPFIIQNDNFFDFAVGKSAGSLSPRVKWEHLKEYEFMLPSIEAQKKLSEVLWAFQDAKETYKKLMTATNELVKSQFIEMFGDEKGYPKVKIEDLVDTNVVKAGKEFSRDEDIKYIDISSINNGTHQITGFTEYTFSDAPSRAQQLLRRNDILVSTVRPNLKNVAVVPYDYDNVVGSSGFCVLRSKNCLLRYLQYIVISDEFTEAMILKTTGTNYPAIRDKDVLEYLVPSPPLELQKQFSEFVEQVDKSKFALLQNIEKLEQCRNALMQKSFG